MNKRILLFLGLLAGFCQAALADDFDRIIEIKLHSDQYLWGQARVPGREDAIKIAQDVLLDEVNEWRANNATNLSAEEMMGRHQVICVQKGRLYVALAYIPKDRLTGAKPAPAVPESPVATLELVEVPVTDPAAAAEPEENRSDDAVALILATPKVDTLLERLQQEEWLQRCCVWGEIDASTKPSDLNKSYLVVYHPDSHDVVAVLTPREPNRINLFTGDNDSTSRYPGHKAIWITVKD